MTDENPNLFPVPDRPLLEEIGQLLDLAVRIGGPVISFQRTDEGGRVGILIVCKVGAPNRPESIIAELWCSEDSDQKCAVVRSIREEVDRYWLHRQAKEWTDNLING